jgi:hypothetical protein
VCDDAAVTAPDFDLLATGLRSRASSVQELAGLGRRDEGSVRADLRELERHGYLTLSGDRIKYADLPGALAGDVTARADDLLARLTGLVGELTGVAGGFPEVVRAWTVGQRPGALAEIEVFHGESAVTDLWHHLLGRHALRRTDIALPDASSLFVADPGMQATWHEVIGADGNRARVLASLRDGTHPEAQARVGEEVAAGLELRLMPRPPSWFWVADETIVALPLQWGEEWPTSVVAIHSRSVAGLASWAFEQLWDQAVPVGDDDAGDDVDRDRLLRLMTNGATLEAASRALGISERTGRRRLAAAMDHYRAPNLLALGVAWGRRSRRQA